MIDLTDRCFLCNRDSNLVVYFMNRNAVIVGLCKNHDYDQVAPHEWKRLSRAEVMVLQIMEQ